MLPSGKWIEGGFVRITNNGTIGQESSGEGGLFQNRRSVDYLGGVLPSCRECDTEGWCVF